MDRSRIDIMWFLKSIIYACIYGSIVFVAANKNCDQNVVSFDWESEDGSLPVHLEYLDLKNTENFTMGIEKGAKQDTNITVYVDPYVNSSDNCTKIPWDSRNLYKFWENQLYKKNGPRQTLILRKALNGCYYVKATNATGHNFLYVFPHYRNFKTHFYDWNVQCRDAIFLPGESTINSRFELTLEIPLRCAKIEMELYQILTTENSTTESARSKDGESIGNCWFTNKKNSCFTLINGTQFNVTQHDLTDNESWMAYITWSNLRNEANYSSKFQIMKGTCEMNHEDVKTWMPAYTFSSMDHGSKTPDNFYNPILESSADKIAPALGILMGLILTGILIYWIRKYIMISIGSKKIGQPQPVRELENIEPSEYEILLMYVRSSTPDLRRRIEDYRKYLKEKCRHKVRDIYSTSESSTFNNLGANDWVEEQMKVNNKFVWFDTPEFRSFIQNDGIQIDHRDAAIPCAINLTKNIFMNVTTQYRHHFVVRVEGFDVTDRKQDDPLYVISSGIRYYLPQNLDELCADLSK